MLQAFYASVCFGKFLRSAKVCISKIFLAVAADNFQKDEF